MIKSYKDFLEERVSDIVFHATTINNVLKILRDNKFRLGASVGTKSEKDINKEKFYYLSVARSPMSSYVALDPYLANTYLTLDGRKLSQRYKGKPVDYWGPEFRKVSPTKNEMEDRIFTDQQYIENAMSYIKEIHVLGTFTNMEDPGLMGRLMGEEPKEVTKKMEDRYLIVLKEIYKIAKKNEIPVYVYTSKEAFSTRNKKKTINTLELLKNDGVFKMKADVYPSRKEYDSLIEWKKLLGLPVKGITSNEQLKEKLGKRGYQLLIDLIYDRSDLKSRLDSDIHNMKTKEKIGPFIDEMKKLKLKSTEDVINYLKEKWKSVKGLE